jgi:xylan 1,4-beta-xylosidase
MTMSEVSQDADQFAYWCLSDVYDQAGYNKETFAGHYGMLNLQGLRKPSYNAHRLLKRLGTERLECEGGSQLKNVIATKTDTGYGMLAYLYPQNIKDAVTKQIVSIVLPTNFKNVRVFRITTDENNIISHWKSMGSPDYLSKGQLRDLKEANGLTPALGAVTIADGPNGKEAQFLLECPGTAYLEIVV